MRDFDQKVLKVVHGAENYLSMLQLRFHAVHTEYQWQWKLFRYKVSYTNGFFAKWNCYIFAKMKLLVVAKKINYFHLFYYLLK